MATVSEEYPTEEQRSVVRFCEQKDFNAKAIPKEMFPVYGEKCLSCKGIHNWVEKFRQGRSKVADDETEVWKYVRQQSNNFYAAGFDTLVKR
jgi:hypothetical protein